jgi:hypothetical protein
MLCLIFGSTITDAVVASIVRSYACLDLLDSKYFKSDGRDVFGH